jgi:glutamyl-tRNA reductase
MDTEVIRGVRVSHDRANIGQIETAAGESADRVVESLLGRDGVREAFAIQTCNRVEAYVVAESVDAGREALEMVWAGVDDDVVVEMGHEGSLRHLMRVAAGLESLVLGEDQILGQFKRAVEAARDAGGIGPTLEMGLTKAVHVGERARTETGINEGVTSIGSAAVRLAERETDLAGATALVIGAGEMGKLAARALSDADVAELIVANRTVERAEEIAEGVDAPASAVSLDAVQEPLSEASVVVTATGYRDYLIGSEDIETAGETLVVDLAQPRDVDPAAAGVVGVAVRDIDDLETVTAETRVTRKAAAEEVEAMIDEEFDRLLEEYKRRQADEAISTMYEAAERIKAREIETAVSQLEAGGDLTDEQREAVESMADALVGQLLSAPTKSLRAAAAEDDWSTIRTAMELFDPQFGTPGDGRQPGEGLEAVPEAHREATASDDGAEHEGRGSGRPPSTVDVDDVDGMPQHLLEGTSDD